MDYGIKVSRQGFDVIDLEKGKSEKVSAGESLPAMLLALALPYLYGARKQIERYETAASLLQSQSTSATMECIHEVSNLFEDLNVVSIYLKKCSKGHTKHKLFNDVRNYIRHAVRDEFDIDDDKRKNRMAQELGIDPKLQMSIGFDIDAIKIGSTLIKMSDIREYLNWAEQVFAETMDKAREVGFLKHQ